ncbi:hypothetical protein RND81_04G109400 [Saponaria officinalis]|uniref:DUF4283 domain-containing protein n=1 Tax=Saponaria officinalis TaxID=3572 RepID=A0AAW1LKF2_SAPOF
MSNFNRSGYFDMGGSSIPRAHNNPLGHGNNSNKTIPQHAWRYPRTGPILTLNPNSLLRFKAYWGKCVLGYMVDYRVFSAFALNRYIEDHWVTRGRVRVHRLGDIYALHCTNDEDKEDLLERSVASFDGALMVFTKWSQGVVPRSVRFPYTFLWVRVYGLPFEYLTMEVADVVGNLLGRQYMV